MKKIKFPTKNELRGLRMGQAIWNAIAYRYQYKEASPTRENLNDYVSDGLFYIENKELVHLLEEYIGDYKESIIKTNSKKICHKIN